MTEGPASRQQLLAENAALRARLNDAEETLRAIQVGEADALVLSGPGGDRIHTLEGALEPYRIMVEAMGEGAVTLTRDGSLLYCNGHFAEWVKLPCEQIVGMSLREMIAKQDRERFAAMLPRGAQGGVRETLTLQAADGSQTPALFSMSPLPQSEGRMISVVIADLSEVAAAAAARSRLALIVDSSDDAIASITLDGVVESWNRAAERLYGYAAGEAIGQTFDSLIVPPERSDEVAQEFEAIGRGVPTLLTDTVRQRKDGTQVAVSVKASPILDEAGKVVGASINSRDITERQRLEEARDRATYLLGERIKEISCLHAISTIVGKSDLSIEQRLRRVVDRIPTGFQYPEVTCARLTRKSGQYCSAEFKETAWRLVSAIEEEGEESGSLEVFYMEERPASDEGPFIQDERDLVNTVGRILGDFLQLEHSLSQLVRFRDLVDASNDAVFVIDPGSARFLDVNKQACSTLGYSRDELLRLRPMDVDAVLPGESAWDEHVREMKKVGSMLLEGEERRKDGSTFPVETSLQYVSRDEGDYIVAIARDITERKKAEHLLEETGKMARVGGWEIGAESMTVLWSKEVHRIHEVPLGYSPTMPEAMNFYAPEDRPVIQQAVQRALDFGEPFDEELQFITAKGNHLWVHAIGKPELRNGKTVKLSGTFQDITERKLADEALRKSEEEFRTLAEAMPQIVWITRADGWNIYFNQHWMDYTGLTLEESRGDGWNKPFHPDDQQQAWDAWQKATTTGGIYSIESRLRRADGTYRWWLIRGIPLLDADGSILKWLGTCTDIHDLKRAELELKLFRNLIDHSNDAIEVLEPATLRFLDINETGRRALGYSREELLGMSAFDIDPAITPEIAKATEDRLRHEGSAHFETEHQRRDGSTFPVEVHATLIELDKPYLLSIARDITERRQTQALLQQSEAKFRALVESTSDWIWESDHNGVYTYVSPRVEALLGYPPEAVLGKTPFDFMPADEMQRVGEGFKELIDQRAPILALEHANLHRDGHVVILETSGIPFYDDKGEFSGYRGVDRDITERKAAEEEIEYKNTILQTQQEASPDAILLVDENAQIISYNQQFIDMWHVPPQVLGTGLDAAVLNAVIGNVENAETFFARVQYLYEHRDEKSHEEIPFKDGRIIDRYSSAATGADCVYYGRVWYFRDITDRKRVEAELAQHRRHLEERVTARTAELAAAEARTRLILDSSADGLYGVDQQGITTFINPIACQLLGYRPDEVIGRSIHQLIHHHYSDGTILPESQCPITATLREGETIRDNDATFWRADGQPLSVGFISHPILEGEQITGAVVSFFDNSVERDAKEAKMRALEEAERLAHVRSEFLANMSHEIRTPLNGVLGFAQVGLRDSEGHASFETFGRIMDSGQLLLGIVNDILDFSKIDAGKLVLEQGVVDLARMVNHVTAMVRTRAEEKGLDFQVEMAPDLPARCAGDGLRLSQVLANLLTNAIKFTQRGQVSLTAEREDNHLVFRVIDSGIGMDPGQITRLFQPFEQADSSTTRKFGGTGLGLVISKRLVELMNGSLSVQSESAAGSTFEVRIPLLDAEGQIDLHPGTEPAPARQVAERRLEGLSLLVAEDNEVNRLVLEQMLAPEGCRLTLVEDGRLAVEAVRKAGATGFDLALMDVQMPELDGYAATRQIHEIAPALPVIALTAHAMAEERERCREAGMVAHVAKPVELDHLIAAILSTLGRDAMAPPAEGACTIPTGKRSEQVLIDWGALAARYANQPQFLTRLLKTILASNAECPTQLRQAAESAKAGDFTVLAAQAHSLKGLAGYVLPAGTHQRIVELNRLAREEQAECVALAGKVADELDAILQEIQAHLAEFGPSPKAPRHTAIDWVSVTELVNQLAPLIDSSDIDAISLFEKERPQFEAACPEIAQKLGQHLALFDFEAAQTDLTEVKTICQQQAKPPN